MPKKFTDKQIKNMIADYAECENYTKVAKRHNTTRQTVKKLVESDADFNEKLRNKKKENSKDVLAHLETKKEKVCGLIDTYLEALADKEKISSSTPTQIATVLGIMIDKFAMISGNNDNGKIEELIKGLLNDG